MSNVPELRIRRVTGQEVSAHGDFVLYWMISCRRTRYNFSLQRAVEWARELNKPLVIFEALRCDYPWASDRLHQFVVEGMADNAQQLVRKKSVLLPLSRIRTGWRKRAAEGTGESCMRGGQRRLPGVLSASHDRCGCSAGPRTIRIGGFQRIVADARRREGVCAGIRLSAFPAEEPAATLGRRASTQSTFAREVAHAGGTAAEDHPTLADGRTSQAARVGCRLGLVSDRSFGRALS